MSIEEAIKNHADHAKWLEEQGCDVTAREFRQVEAWLQELKERREKESRKIPQDMTEEACESIIRLTENIIEILPNIVESVIANMPEAIEKYLQGKEESK